MSRRARQPRGKHPETWPRAGSSAMSIALTVPERAQRVVASDLEISILGSCEYPSPLAERLSQASVHYVGQADRVLLDDRLSRVSEHREDLSRAPAFELAGPRHRVFFDPETLRCGIVTCGGLFAGLHNGSPGPVSEPQHGLAGRKNAGSRYVYERLVSRLCHEPIHFMPSSIA